jgi:diguanylate cyclase (GGDEF)-like protein/PAS domain S-box-containing protein
MSDAKEIRRGNEDELRQILLEYQAILDNASLGITFTRNRTFLHCNDRFSEMFGWPGDELVGRPTDIVYPSAEAYEALGRIAGPTLSAGKRMDTELMLMRRDGSLFWCRMLANAIDPRDHSKGSIFITEDISERKAADEALKQIFLEQQAILDNALIGIAFLKGRNIVRCNARLEQLYGYDPGELNGVSSSILYRSEQEFETGNHGYLSLIRTGSHTGEVLMQKKDGTMFWCHLSGNLVEKSDPGKGSVWLAEDITQQRTAQEALMRARDTLEVRVLERTAELATANARLEQEIQERRLAEEQVRHLAHHDALTGLPNRRLLEDRLEQALVRARRQHLHVATLFIDLDRFKVVNDTLGHRVGDLLLCAVANRLRELLREGDTVSRVGGDEFVLVLPDMSTVAAASDTAQKLLDSLAEPYSIETHMLYVTPSIGISIFPKDGTNVETLISRADSAMYRAKEMGRRNFQVFDVGMV